MGRQQAWCKEARIGRVWTVCRSFIDGQLCSEHPKAMTQRGNDVSNICRFVPKLTVNGQFMRDFMAEESPCFALGLVEERKQLCGFLALRPAEVIPPEISGLGFNFGHALLGTTEFEVIQFVFSLLWLRDLQHTGQSEQPPGKEGVDEDGGKRRLLFLCH